MAVKMALNGGRRPRSTLLAVNTLKCLRNTLKTGWIRRVAAQSTDRKAGVQLYKKWETMTGKPWAAIVCLMAIDDQMAIII